MPEARSRRLVWIIAAAAAVVAVTGLLVWILGGDEPPEVDAERALEQPPADAPSEDPPVDDPAPDDEVEPEEPEQPEPDEPDNSVLDVLEPTEDVEVEELSGRWTIDPTRHFDRAAGTGSFVGYRVREVLSGIGDNVAVGRSPEVEAVVTIEARTVVAAEVYASLAELESDDGRRDNRVRGMLGPDATASFELAGPIELPEIPPAGEVVELATTGTLTILGTAQEVTVELQAAVMDEDRMVVTGSTRILFDDYDIEPPSAPIVLSVADEAVLEWQLFLVRDA